MTKTKMSKGTKKLFELTQDELNKKLEENDLMILDDKYVNLNGGKINGNFEIDPGNIQLNTDDNGNNGNILIKYKRYNFPSLHTKPQFISWDQVGTDIDGTLNNEELGYSVSLSSDGNTLAVSSIKFSNNKGKVQIYSLNKNSATWSLNQVIEGNNEGDNFGCSISLSSDGTVLAIGAKSFDNNRGQSSIYILNENTFELRTTINGENESDQFGYSISLSSDGDIIAISSPKYNGNGIVKVYVWNDTIYEQKGTDLFENFQTEQFDWFNSFEFGSSISMSNDGNIIAIGTNFKSTNNTIQYGLIHVYIWNENVWEKRGLKISGESTNDIKINLSLSGDGNILATNSLIHNGAVKVYYWDGNAYVIRGEAISDGDNFGDIVSLSENGNTLMIGSPFKDSGENVKIYSWDGTDYVQKGSTFNAENNNDQFGGSISISSNGEVFAIGGIMNNADGINKGHVRVFIENADMFYGLKTNLPAYDFDINGNFNANTIYEENMKLEDKYELKGDLNGQFLPIIGGTVSGNVNVGLGETLPNSRFMVSVITPSVKCGASHTVVLQSDGKVKTFGYNYYGQLGNNTFNDSNTPVQVNNIDNAISISAGIYNTAVVLNDGTVKTFGRNNYGQLGNNSNDNSNIPVSVNNINNAISVACGGNHVVVLLNDGTIKSFGRNNKGQLGNGNNNDSNFPVDVIGINNAISVACGFDHTVVLLNDGTIKTFGYNEYGQLGNGNNNDSNTPVDNINIDNINNVISIACGDNHTIVLLNDGSVKTFGLNNYGQLGDNTENNFSNVAKDVIGIIKANFIEGGSHHTAIVMNDGSLKTFGLNEYGQLGDNTNDNKKTPVNVSGIINALMVSCGKDHTCILLKDGNIKTFGKNDRGQLGDNSNNNSYIPISVENIPILINNFFQIKNPMNDYFSINSTGIYANGKIGINNPTPYSTLDIITNGDGIMCRNSSFKDSKYNIGANTLGAFNDLYDQNNNNVVKISSYSDNNNISGWIGDSNFGNFGIKTTNPQFPLDIDGDIRATSFINSSDKRIKKNIVELNDTECLEKLRDLKPVKYEYIDKEKLGSSIVYGFIAQDIKETIPYASKIIKSFIPDYYKNVENINYDSYIITFEIEENYDITLNQKIELNISCIKNDTLFKKTIRTKVLEINNKIITIENKMKNCSIISIFLYGKQVDDFHTIKKDAIWTIATSAIQEIDRIQQVHTDKINDMNNLIKSLEERIILLETNQ